MATYPTPPFGGSRKKNMTVKEKQAMGLAIKPSRKGSPKKSKDLSPYAMPKKIKPRTSGAMTKGVKPRIAAPTAIKRIRKTY